MGVTGTYEPPVASGGGLKSVTKTYTKGSSSYNLGLTDIQKAGVRYVSVSSVKASCTNTQYSTSGSLTTDAFGGFIGDSITALSSATVKSGTNVGAVNCTTKIDLVAGTVGPKCSVGGATASANFTVTYYYFE